MKLRQKLGQEAFDELNKLVKQNIDIRRISSPEDFVVKKKTLEMLLEWVQSVYELDEPQISELMSDDFDMNQMFKLRN
jgi:hypothetical protein